MNKEQKQEKWWVIDAEGQVLGRLASKVATLLRGKHYPSFVPNKVCGDFVVIKNVEKVKLTGSKLDNKIYYSHSGYIGNLKSINAGDLLKKHPERLVQYAVKGMLPKNKLRDRFMKRLKIYIGSGHPHEAQKPEEFKLS